MARHVNIYLASDTRHQHPLTQQQIDELPQNAGIVLVTPRGRDIPMTVGKLIQNDQAARLAAGQRHP
jgi:hypothetical protein